MRHYNIKHIFFDLDHTLWDFDKNSELAFESVFEKNAIQLKLKEFLNVYTPINADYWKLYREDKISKNGLRHGRLKDSFTALDTAVPDKQIEQIAIDYIDHLPNNNHLLDGVIDVLDYLKPKYKLHIITNGFKEVQQKKMEKSGIIDYFTTITTSEDVGVKKPGKLIFSTALESAGAHKDESLMIGDNLEADVIGAIDFGMQAIIYNYYNEEYPIEYHQVKEMRELLTLL